ncbi:MAG: hypothetical protein QOI11_918 [Candidatus Eremiobacteraeota bacterium]|nr:hypothetical protein [Candidatus Eremiobacteraeota bacterium]
MTTDRRAVVNLVLSTSAFAISAGGSVLLQIVFATTIYEQTGSGLLSSLFISLQYLPALLVLIFKNDWESRGNPSRRWLRLELLAALMTCPILLFVGKPNYVMLFLLLFARGIVDHIARVIKAVAARYIFPPDKVTRYAPILQSGFHVGIGLAAVVGIATGKFFTTAAVTKIDIASFLVAAALLAFVKPFSDVASDPEPALASFRARLAEYRSMLAADRRLLFSAVLPPLSSSIFQGSYSVFLPLFPIRALGLPANAVAVGYVLVSAAILGGSSVFSYANHRYEFFKTDFVRIKRNVLWLSCASAAAYLTASVSHKFFVCAVLLTAMVFIFELVWMSGYTGIFAYAPKGRLGSIISISYGFGFCAASSCIVLTGVLLDYFKGSFPSVVAILMGIYLVCFGALYAFSVGPRRVIEPPLARSDAS